MATCTCCRAPLAIAQSRNPRPMTYDFIYAVIFECPNCMSTQCHVLWELPDEMLDEQRKVRTARLALENLESAAKRFENLAFDNGDTLRDLNAAILVARLDLSNAEMDEFMAHATRAATADTCGHQALDHRAECCSVCGAPADAPDPLLSKRPSTMGFIALSELDDH